MSDRSQPMESLPDRPLERTELATFEASDSYDAVLWDDELSDQEALAWNCVLVTADIVLGAVYDDAEAGWFCVHGAPRESGDLTAAYEAIREDRGTRSLFSGAPLSVAEAAFLADRKHGESASYEAGDDFDCPVCGEHHEVQRESVDVGYDDLAEDLLFVACPDARNGRLVL